MKRKEDQPIRENLETENALNFRDQMRNSKSNRKTVFTIRKERYPYTEEEDELVEIQRAQGEQGLGVEIPNQVSGTLSFQRKLRNDRYIVEKQVEGECPNVTSTAAEHTKPWVDAREDPSDEDSAGCEGEFNIQGQMSSNGRACRIKSSFKL